MIIMLKKASSFFIIILFCASCSSIFGDKLVLTPTSFADIDGWHSDNHGAALASFLKSCARFSTIPPKRKLHINGIGGTYGDWQNVCEKAANIEGSNVAKHFFEDEFQPYLASNWGKEDGLFTGYFEIGLEGSRYRYGHYQYPIYSKPADIKAGKAYYSRKQIENGALSRKNLEIAWVKDPVRAFFLHIQGSGQIFLEDGSILRVGYDGKNNHKYVSLGRYMIDKNYIKKENMSAPAIKTWLYKHPRKAKKIMQKNPSYVFFREIGDEGPIGGQGVALTPMRSLAIDKRFMPYGAPVWVDVALNKSTKKFQKLLVAQDTGAAIKGPVRGDLFFGAGENAEQLAGYQNSRGKYFLLLPKGI